MWMNECIIESGHNLCDKLEGKSVESGDHL